MYSEAGIGQLSDRIFRCRASGFVKRRQSDKRASLPFQTNSGPLFNEIRGKRESIIRRF